MRSSWQDEAEDELNAARAAAQDNLEGRSRVLARRAAGQAVRRYFEQVDHGRHTNNYYTLLQEFSRQPDVSDEMRTTALHLCQRVNHDHHLPDNIDLISEAQSMIHYIANVIGQQEIKDKNMEDTTPKIKLYATAWCFMSRNTKKILDHYQVVYDYIDIDKDKVGEDFVIKTNNGNRSVPTLLFPDGSTLTEPSQSELITKLNLKE
ncbi:MAG: hypothetical protein JW704_05880 [Anaerolineaceae bacterium]|nr:hypothetical protein [Anaerolineaceae bacterium]MBN2676502.1 hypothetical protein [Anaerolineaceae bacterium]